MKKQASKKSAKHVRKSPKVLTVRVKKTTNARSASPAEPADDRQSRRTIADAFFDEELCDAAAKLARKDMAKFWQQAPTK